MILLVLLLAAPPSGLTEFSLRLIGRFNSGHACPVSATKAWTNAHVVDLRPFDESVRAFPYPWSDGGTGEGYVVPVRLERARDLAVMQATEDRPFRGWFPVAQEAAKPGDKVWLLGYQWGNWKSALADDVIETEVVRLRAGHFTFGKKTGKPGSSGSCVLNERGEVVGINVGGWSTDDDGMAGSAVSVWGWWGKFE